MSWSTGFGCHARDEYVEVDSIVQLGYDGSANPILFEPTFAEGKAVFPDRGSRVERDRLLNLAPLRMARPAVRPVGAETLH